MASLLSADDGLPDESATSMDQQDPRNMLLNAPMSRFQIAAIIVTLALCALDGFDVLAITFAAPAILPEWGIDKAQLGYQVALFE